MSYVEQIRERISEQAFALLRRSGVGNAEETYGLLSQFPSIAKDPSVNLAKLSNAVASSLSTAAMNTIQNSARTAVTFATGSVPPPLSLVGNGYQEPAPSSPVGSVSGLPSNAINHPLSTLIRDQGQRGTCVAHGVAAALEAFLSHPDLSEQFLYWAAKIKGGDPFPDNPGTWLRCASNSLRSVGVCEEPLWGYNKTPNAGNETQENPGIDPSTNALTDALARVITVSTCRDVSTALSGKAAVLASKLAAGPVAITVPVFVDTLTNVSNWSWSGACQYGHVLDPTQYSIVKGGHCVCVHAFEPSSAAPGHGWFVFKNSWDPAQWSASTATPPPGHPACPSGFGYLSAAYIEDYLWELLRP